MMNRGGISADAGGRPGFVPKASTLKESKHVHVSRTLYVTNIAPGTSNEALEKLFRGLDGFIAMRRVRSMCFIDFQEKQQATSAIWRTNGHKFKPSDEGILVSYDKDDSEERGGWSIRKKEEEKRRKQQIDATRILYRCTACNHTCLRLARPLSEMPVRKTDGSRVVDAANDLVYLAVVKGGAKLLKREKGIEKQWRYKCELCDVVVGYRPVDYEQDTKYVYIFPEAVHTNKPGVRDVLPSPGALPPTAPETSAQQRDADADRLQNAESVGVGGDEVASVSGAQSPPSSDESRPSTLLRIEDQNGLKPCGADQVGSGCAHGTPHMAPSQSIGDGLLPLPNGQGLVHGPLREIGPVVESGVGLLPNR